MSGQSTQATSPTVFRKMTDPLRNAGQKLTRVLKDFQVTKEEKEKAGIYIGHWPPEVDESHPAERIS